jgi:hypothetical protein
MIYHPVFTDFLNDMSTPLDGLTFTHEELASAANVMEVAMRFHSSESERVDAMRQTGVLDAELLTQMEVSRPSGTLKPDGRSRIICSKLPGQPEAFAGLQVVKNEPVEGGSDSIPQAECNYRAIISKDEVRSLFTMGAPFNVCNSTN